MSLIKLLIPGLFHPPARVSDTAAVRAPRLERLLSSAEVLPAAEDYFAQLVQLAGQSADTPAAPIALLGEGLEPGDSIWMRASPVHLRADLANLMLFDSSELQIQPAEAEDLVAAFNQHFAARKLSLIAPHPQRWYLRMNLLPQLQTWPLEQVAGRSPQPFLPQGADAPAWRALLTEVQMLFHAHGVNRQRQTLGQQAINGLWLEGLGRLPLAVPSPLSALAGDDVLLRGLARWLGLAQISLEDAAGEGELRLIMALQRAQQLEQWQRSLQQFDAWLEQPLTWLKGHRDRRLWLFDGSGQGFDCSGSRGLRFWRSPKPFGHYLTQPGRD